MPLSASLIEIREYTGTGYAPLVDYGAWRVAILRFIDELLPEKITSVQRHDETDEVFILLEGKCILFLGEPGQDGLTAIHAVDMQPLKLYNVKRGSWHTHTLDKAAVVLIVENCDTVDANSPVMDLTPAQRQEIVSLTQSLWVRA